MKRKNYNNWKSAACGAPKAKIFKIFELFWRSTTVFSFTWPEWGGHVPGVPTLNTLLAPWAPPLATPITQCCRVIKSNFSNGVYIGIGRHKISLTEANEVPPFLRFDIVQISYGYVWQPIKEKCELSESYLLILKPALIDSDMIEVYAGICEGDPSDFSNHLQLIEYIQNQLLSFCISPRSYKFHIYFYSDENSVPNLIASLLQMDELRLCSNIEIEIRIRHQEKRFGFEKQLPVEAIANWLEKYDDKMEIIDRTKERILKIELRVGIQNPQEMLEHLIKVSFNKLFQIFPRWVVSHSPGSLFKLQIG